jgi:two-component system, NarL family, invasion response regulator UvrY
VDNVIRILIADDHAIFRRGLMEILTESFKTVAFAEVRTTEEAIEQVRKREWELVILDIGLPDHGLEALDEIKRVRPDLPVLVFSSRPEEQLARRALQAGAAGYLTKDIRPDELTRAVGRMLAGDRYVGDALAERLAKDVSEGSDKPLYELLSRREFQVLRMLAAGKTVGEVAVDLGLSVKTVSTYRARILEKTGMKNNAQLIRYAVDNRLVQ